MHTLMYSLVQTTGGSGVEHKYMSTLTLTRRWCIALFNSTKSLNAWTDFTNSPLGCAILLDSPHTLPYIVDWTAPQPDRCSLDKLSWIEKTWLKLTSDCKRSKMEDILIIWLNWLRITGDLTRSTLLCAKFSWTLQNQRKHTCYILHVGSWITNTQNGMVYYRWISWTIKVLPEDTGSYVITHPYKANFHWESVQSEALERSHYCDTFKRS